MDLYLDLCMVCTIFIENIAHNYDIRIHHGVTMHSN